MLFNKRKKEEEERRKELEQREQRRQSLAMQLQREREQQEREAAAREAEKPVSPYKFSKPDPWPKELASVLKEMFKKLFPDAKKAYLLSAEYEGKTGYLLVVDIDARYLKIINIYLDGETKRVRQDKPIECILYSKSGSLTDGMLPFYEKAESQGFSSVAKESEYAFKSALEDIRNEYSSDFETEKEEQEEITLEIETKTEEEIEPETEIEASQEIQAETETEEEIASEPEAEAEEEIEPETEIETPQEIQAQPEIEEEITSEPETETEEITSEAEAESEEVIAQTEPEEDKAEPEPEEGPSVRVVPETKQQLFALMSRAGSSDNEETQSIAYAGFGEFKFYIPYESDEGFDGDEEREAFPENSRLVMLINKDNGIKAIPFFTDKEDIISFAKEKNCSFACMKYADYKKAANSGGIVSPAAEGIIINPDSEQILLPPDYPLL